LNLANLHECPIERGRIARLAVRVLDNSIDLSLTPIEASRTHNKKYRTIGVGMMGAADFFAVNGWRYDEHVAEIGNLFEDLAFDIYSASADLAIERGAYPAFIGSQWHQGRPIGLDINEVLLNSHSQLRWFKLNEQIMKTGIRNSQCIAIAPNGSSGLIQGATPSILPAFKRKYSQKNGEGILPIIPPYMGKRFWFYQENIHLDQTHVVNCVAEIQKWVDTGISMELVLNTNVVKPMDYYNLIFQAWRKKCKSIYYIRTVDPQTTQAGAVACDACT
jgi:ribonucleoside-diphosphate reductase alpha chain